MSIDNFINKIKEKERSTRRAITSKHPFLLPFILKIKRSFISLYYTTHPSFKTEKSDNAPWFQLARHSSPLYRKYNTRELDEGKIENIKIAIESIHGVTIPPGNIFSLWKHIGQPSAKKGFKKGLVLSNGVLKEDIGGGLCQLSNLIAYMFACTECKFIERKHHSKDVFPDYNRVIPFASGATVFYNLIDLKVKNTYPFPLKIDLHTTDTQLRGSINIPVLLDYNIKLEEKESYFLKSLKTGILYRCNTLSRVFYKKKTKEKIKDEDLWTNTAQVMYDEKTLTHPIITIEK